MDVPETTLANLTEADRTTLSYAALWVFSTVAGSDGRIDEAEVDAILAELVKRAPPRDSELLRTVLSDVSSDGSRTLGGYAADGRSADEGLRRVAAILDLNWSRETGQDFKRGLLDIGRAVASASGGLLGLGNRTSGSETKALEVIARQLGVRDADGPSESNESEAIQGI
jgi:hypothetical protein